MSPTSTLIIGGGFGGISAANTLRRLLPEEHEIAVIDKSPSFHVGAGKTWIMLGERTAEQISRLRPELLEPGVRFVQASVLGLDLATSTVATDKGTLGWNHLVIALGADVNLASVPGLAPIATSRSFVSCQTPAIICRPFSSFSQSDISPMPAVRSPPRNPHFSTSTVFAPVLAAAIAAG